MPSTYLAMVDEELIGLGMRDRRMIWRYRVSRGAVKQEVTNERSIYNKCYNYWCCISDFSFIDTCCFYTFRNIQVIFLILGNFWELYRNLCPTE